MNRYNYFINFYKNSCILQSKPLILVTHKHSSVRFAHL